MLLWLTQWLAAHDVRGFQVFSYITLRGVLAADRARHRAVVARW